MKPKGPDTPSSDRNAMMPYWQMVAALLDGTDAMRAAGEKYLPKFPREKPKDYDFRLNNAKFTNIFGDIVETLSAKPFAKEITVEADKSIQELLENIDGQGSHIHVFAANSFYHGIANGIDWILVDYTKVDYTNNIPGGATRDFERQMGARPYWVHIAAPRVLAAHSEVVAGESVLTHFRFQENVTTRDGYGETDKERVREFNRDVVRNDNGSAISAGMPTWMLWEKTTNDRNESEWVPIDRGVITIGVIPVVPFVSGRRQGGSWRITPPLKSAAFLQIEHFQEENGLKNARTASGFPMLAASGVTPPVGEKGEVLSIETGPNSVLFAPPGGDGQPAGSFSYLQPDPRILQFLSSDIKDTEKQLRELGRQPLTAQSGNITTITAAFAGDKAHTVIEAWAVNYKDTLENALKLTAKWLGKDGTASEPTVQINTDFSLDMKEDSGADSLDKMRTRGEISLKTYWLEYQRRGILNPNFDADAELELILGEIPSDNEDDLTDALPQEQDNEPPGQDTEPQEQAA